jgi:ribosomal protein L7/L12
MHDGTLVTSPLLSETLEELQARGMDDARKAFEEMEPHLSGFVRENATHIAGKMSLAGAPRSVVRGVFHDILNLVTLCYHAQRRGVYQLWKDTTVAEGLLARLGEAAPTPTEAAPKPTGEAAPVDLLLTAVGERRTALVRTLRRLTGQPLAEVKALTEATPSVLLRQVPVETARQAKAAVERAGGSALIV